MGIMEIILLIIGIAFLIASFFLPVGKEESPAIDKELTKEEIRGLVAEQMEEIRSRVDDTVEEAVDYAIEKTERSLERISNEKIMAVNEYSDTVLSEINKNHKEVMFLYDMLIDKHTSLKNTASEVEKTAKEAKDITKEAKRASKEVQEATRNAEKIFPVFQPLQAETIVLESEEKISQEEENLLDKSTTNEKILALHKSGKSKVDIAKELGLGVGEVSLVIDLFKG